MCILSVFKSNDECETIQRLSSPMSYGITSLQWTAVISDISFCYKGPLLKYTGAMDRRLSNNLMQIWIFFFIGNFCWYHPSNFIRSGLLYQPRENTFVCQSAVLQLQCVRPLSHFAEQCFIMKIICGFSSCFKTIACNRRVIDQEITFVELLFTAN